MRRSAALLPALALALALPTAACGDDSPKRPIGASCVADAECTSGLCYQDECLDPAADDDGDTLTNAIEAALKTNPKAKDSDGDGVDDADELDASIQPIDTDGDGLADALESRLADQDHDCIVDELDPHNADPSDGQGDPRVATLCPTAGVCAASGAVLAVACPDGLDAPVCAFDAVPGYAAVDDSCDGVDQNCDGSADEDGGCVALPEGCDDVDERVDGRVLIDPDGADGAYAPFEVECLFSVERGGWMRLDAAVHAAIAALAPADAPREYLLVAPNGAWARAPLSAVAWDWTSGASVDGLWLQADPDGTLGGLDCIADAAPSFGVGCSRTSGSTLAPSGANDAEAGTTSVCFADSATAAPTCVDGVAVYVRFPYCVPDEGQLLSDGGFSALARGDGCWYAGDSTADGTAWSFPEDAPPNGSAPSALGTNPAVGSDLWAVQLLQPGLTFLAGRAYRATFWAKATEARTIRIFVQSRDLATYLHTEEVTLGTSWTQLAVSFTAPGSTYDGMFEFQLGEVSTAPVALDDVRLFDLGAVGTAVPVP